MKSRALVCSLLPAILCAQSWQEALPGYRFEFPRDHFSHPDYQTEWWYYTGNLRAVDGHRYGFELTFFRQGAQLAQAAVESEDNIWRPDQLYLAHLALSDLEGHVFYHYERLNRAGPGLAGAALSDARYWNGNWEVTWKDLRSAKQRLAAVGDRFSLQLDLQPVKPPIIQGQDGVSRKGPLPGQASHYISFTRLAAAGRLQQAGAPVEVNGTAWMDHEFFTEPADSNLAGWDWFAIQLKNNEELVLYRLRKKTGQVSPFSSGTYVDSEGRGHFLRAEEFSLIPGKKWQSPHSQAQYPIQWQIHVPSLDLDLAEHTELDDQELWSRGNNSPSYWEGAVTYDGTLRGTPIDGFGYLEMTGYREAIQLSGMTRK
jgi:predicted secreted hydrolase